MSYISKAHIDWDVKKKIYDFLGYEPFGAQPAFHASKALIRIFAAGNQSGKSYAGVREVLPQLLIPIWDDKIGAARGRRGWWVVPRYNLADPFLAEIHELLQGALSWKRAKRGIDLKEGEYHYAVNQHKLTTWTGAVIWIKSADEPASLHAQPLDYILVDEAGLVPYEILQVNLLPRLTVTGGWLAATGTFEDTIIGEWFVDYWRIGRTGNDLGIESFRHPTKLNPYVDKAWLEAQKKIYDPDLYNARFEALPKPNERLVFRHFSYRYNVSASHCEFNPDLPVYLGIDPGRIYAVVAWQYKYIEDLQDSAICVIDEVYDRGGGPTEKIFDEISQREWFGNVGTLDGFSGAIDISEAESYKVFLRRGLSGLSRKRIGIETGNDELRNYIWQRRLLVNPKCTNLLWEFSKYSYPRTSAEHDSLSRNPIDEYNHLIKALIYSIIGKFGLRDPKKPLNPRRYKRRKKRGIF